MTGNTDIWCTCGGGEGTMLLLLHGLGANATVWDGLLPIIQANWPGAWLAPDLRGHGRSAHKPPYGIGVYAADVAVIGNEDQVKAQLRALAVVGAADFLASVFPVGNDIVASEARTLSLLKCLNGTF